MRFLELGAFTLALLLASLPFLQAALPDWRGAGAEWSVDSGFGAASRDPTGTVTFPANVTIYLQLYIQGQTQGEGAAQGVTCYCHRSPGNEPKWFSAPMSYVGESGNNDLLAYTYVENPPKNYEYTFKCIKEGFNEVWIGGDNFAFTISPVSCPADQYRETPTTCSNCPEGSTSPAGSANINGCVCAGDKVLNTQSKTCEIPATSCSENQYVKDGTECIGCPDFSTSPGGTGTIQACTCESPRTLNIAEARCDCPASTYSDGPECASCPEGSTGPEGSDDISSCVCGGGLVLDSYASLCRAPISSVSNLAPIKGSESPSTVRLPSNLTISLEVVKANVTGGDGQGLGIVCYIRVSNNLNNDFSGSWSSSTDFPMEYARDNGEADVHELELSLPVGGYKFVGYCKDENSNIERWRQPETTGHVVFTPAPCEENYYLSPNKECVECPATATSPPESLSIDYCVCPEGEVLITEGPSCQPNELSCPENQYTANGVDCVSCPSGATSLENSTSITQCSCPDPKILDIPAKTCICPEDSYDTAGGCTPCPGGSAADAGSTTLLDCVCDQGTVMDTTDAVCRPVIGWVGNLSPRLGTDSPQWVYLNDELVISLEVYKADITPGSGQGHEISCYLYLSAPLASDFSGAWEPTQEVQMIYDRDSEDQSNDVYIVIPRLDPGHYSYTAYCKDLNSDTKFYQQEGNGNVIFSDGCPSNMYKAMGDCFPCPLESTSPAESVDITSCICTTGTLNPTSGKCVVATTTTTTTTTSTSTSTTTATSTSTAHPTTTTTTATPTPTTTPTSTDASTKPSTVKVVMRITNILYSWYTESADNKQLFESNFIQAMADVLEVSSSSIEIISVKAGSLIVNFKVFTTQPEEVKASATTFIQSQNPNLDTVASALPPAAFENAGQGLSVDAAQSSAEIGKNTPVGAIVGGVVGGFVGLVIIAAIIFFVVKRRRSDDAIEMKG